MFEATVLLRNMVQKDPGIFVKPLTQFFGFILNIIFNLVDGIFQSDINTLGISIIFLTIFVRLILMPLAVKSQKSMLAMQKLQPEIEKIKAKYGESPSTEEQQKMNAEVQNLYSKNKANPFTGCLPVFLQLPVFMAMYYIMNQPYKFIDKLNVIYYSIAEKAASIPGFWDFVYDIGVSKVPKGMSLEIESNIDHLVMVLNKFVEADWGTFLSQVPANYANEIQTLLNTKWDIEQLFSISLTENTGLYWPAIIIPVISVLTTFLSSYLSNKQSKSTDPNVQMQQKMMLFAMPLMMGFFTLNIPGGVGIYWITSNVFQVFQQIILTKVLNKDEPSVIEDKKKPAGKKA